MPEEIKTLDLAGVETRVGGNPHDLYFQSIEQHATELGPLAAIVASRLAAGAMALDVGANIGMTAMLLSRHASQVVAIEPSAINADLLRKNLALNAIGNVRVIHGAASDRAGSLEFHTSEAMGAGSHVVSDRHAAASGYSNSSVEAFTIDSLDLASVAFIKIDTEGYEPEVLVGAARLIERDRPVIVIEINVFALCAISRHNPGTLMRALFRNFHVGSLTEPALVYGDAYHFLYDVIVNHRGVMDVVLELREGCRVPGLDELTA